MTSLPAVGMVVQKAAGKNGPFRRERILWLDRNTGAAVTIALDDDKATPEVMDAEELDRQWKAGKLTETVDDFAYLASADVARHAERLERNWAAIQEIAEDEPRCFDRATRAGLLTEAERVSKRGRNTLLRDLRRYWQAGKQINALIPNYDRSGGPGQSRISDTGRKVGRSTILEQHGHSERGLAVTPEIAKLFDSYLKKYVIKRNPDTISDAYSNLCKDNFSTRSHTPAGRLMVEILPIDRRPSLRQFRYYANKYYGMSMRKKAQDGVEAYEQTMRPVLGNSSVDVMGPGAVFQIDATETDVQLVNSIMRDRPIGRATHYFITDAFSGSIAGLHVGLEAPSMLMVRQTLANAALPKTDFCERFDIPIAEEEWPCHHFPSSLIADRGEVIAKKADAIVEELQLKITNLPAFRPDWKPFVEGDFAQANKLLHTLPGSIKRKRSKVRQRDSRLDAELDIFGVTQILIEFALHYNKSHILSRHPFDLFEIQENVKPRPLDLWRWGVLHRSGALRVKSEDAIRMLLLERGEATVTGFGLRFQEADYDCVVAHEQEWFQKARTASSWKVNICYDRRNLEYIYLMPEGRRPLVACPILRRDEQMVGLSLEEIEDYQQFLGYRNALMREEELGSKINLHARTEDIVEAQKKLTRDRKKSVAPVSKAEVKRGIRDNRNEERTRRNATVHHDLPGGPIAVPPAHLPSPAAEPTSLASYREARNLQLLRDRMKEKPSAD